MNDDQDSKQPPVPKTQFVALPIRERPAPRRPVVVAHPPPPKPTPKLAPDPPEDPSRPFAAHKASMETTFLRLPLARRRYWGLMIVVLFVLGGTGTMIALITGWLVLY